jgi:hypothetical protein
MDTSFDVDSPDGGAILVSTRPVANRDTHPYSSEVLDQTLDTLVDKDNAKSNTEIALLYGCSHCPDLRQGIQQRGFTPVEREWRTAWSVPFRISEATKTTTTVVSKESDSSSAAAILPRTKPVALAATSSASREVSITSLRVISLLIALPVYFVIGGAGWIATLQDVAQSLERRDSLEAIVDTLLYLVRHVLLYVSLSELVLDWQGSGAPDEHE